MLSLYRRHTRGCPFFGKPRHAKGSRSCKAHCPIWVQGTLRGEPIRRSLDLTSWEAASDLVLAWGASGTIGVVKPEVPTVKQAVEKFFRRRRRPAAFRVHYLEAEERSREATPSLV